MKLTQILRNALIGTSIAVLPVTSSIAATRPNAAVPMVGSAASSSAMADGLGGDESIGWIGLALGVVGIGLFALLVLGDDDDEDATSPG